MSGPSQTLRTLNSLQAPAFVAELAEVFEHAPWVAEAAAGGRPYPTVAALHDAMMAAVRSAPPERQRAFIAGHPELGSRVKRADLTDHSKAEQGSLGLDRLSAAEFDRFSRLNSAYRDKFGFPFIICVRRHTRDSILRAVRAAARPRRRDRARPRARRDRADHPAASGRQGRWSRCAANHRPALDPRARPRRRPPSQRRRDRAA